MRLATIRRGGGTVAARVDEGGVVPIEGVADVRALLDGPNWHTRAEAAAGTVLEAASVDYAPLVASPDKIICVGLNYRNHIAETGREPPEFPTLFAKFRSALIGANDDIALATGVEQLDWEAELAVVVGVPARNVSEADAPRVIAGYSVLNDISARDWQNRTAQWLQGKTFEGSTPVGPWMVTSDEFDGRSGEITCRVNGETKQQADIGDLLFGPAALVSYISRIVTLLPGDLIATGTPGGVGVARTPPEFLRDGDVVTVAVAGVGECTNAVRRR